MIERLAVLDFSGTLCLAAPRFAAPEALREELEASGLAALGISPEVFWSELINPTWTAGSTTPTGYRRILTARLEEVLAAGILPPAGGPIAPFVSRFAERYFQSCRVDPLWSRFLRTCTGQAGLATVIASDHYAEATDAIVRSLTGMAIPARPLAGAPASRPEEAVLVANSADLGVPKSSREFWDSVRVVLGCRELKGIFLVDDFGSNEPEGDAYGDPERVRERRDGTAARLGEVFQAPVSCFFFSLRPVAGTDRPAGGPREIPVAARIAEALEALRRFLAV
jgi:hypothetical protein